MRYSSIAKPAWPSMSGCSFYILALLWLVPVELIFAHGMMVPDLDQLPAIEYPPIEEDIQAMAYYGGRAQRAGKRLVEQGEAVLLQVHAQLNDASTPYVQKMQLITVLGEIAHPDSADVIMDVAEQSKGDRYLYQNSLLALAQFQQTGDIVKFANVQLQDEQRDPLIQRSAMAYFAQQPHQDAVQWVEKYGQASASKDVRYAALYLGGMLGMDSVKQDIVELLPDASSIARQYYLLIGLVELTGVDEFYRLTEGLEFYGRNREKIERYLQFRKGDPEQREALAKDMLETGDPTQKRVAMDYLVGNKKADALVGRWRLFDGFVRANVRRAGYEIEVTEQGARFVERPHQHSQGYALIAALLLASVFVVWLGLRVRR